MQGSTGDAHLITKEESRYGSVDCREDEGSRYLGHFVAIDCV